MGSDEEEATSLTVTRFPPLPLLCFVFGRTRRCLVVREPKAVDIGSEKRRSSSPRVERPSQAGAGERPKLSTELCPSPFIY